MATTQWRKNNRNLVRVFLFGNKSCSTIILPIMAQKKNPSDRSWKVNFPSGQDKVTFDTRLLAWATSNWIIKRSNHATAHGFFLKSCQYPDLCCLSTVRAKVGNHRKNFFQGSKRWRVVTLKGELIDQSGKVIALYIELIVFLYYSICYHFVLFLSTVTSNIYDHKYW